MISIIEVGNAQLRKDHSVNERNEKYVRFKFSLQDNKTLEHDDDNSINTKIKIIELSYCLL